MSTLGQKIKQLRENKNLNQEELSLILGFKNRATLANWETGRTEPDNETLLKIADFFEVSIDSLLGRKEKIKNDVPEITLNPKDMSKIKEEANRIKSLMMTSLGMAFDGEIEDEETLTKVMAALEEGLILAKKEAKEKYTPKKFRK